MSSPRRIPLSPCDYLIFNHHCLMRRKHQGQYLCLMMVDLQGPVEPDRIRAALAAAMRAHPVASADLRFTLASGRPYWRIPRLVEEADRRAAQAHWFCDLRACPQSDSRLEELIRQRSRERLDPRTGPQVRLDQYALADDRTRLCLRWLHYFMDAEGAQLFLREIGRLDRAAHPVERSSAQNCLAEPEGHREHLGSPLRSLPDDDRPVDALAQYSWRERLDLVRRGLASLPKHPDLRIKPLHRRVFPPAAEHRIVNCCWDRRQAQDMQDRARQVTPPGPGRYARHLAGCVIRAIHRIFVEQGVDTEAYLIPMPVRVNLPIPQADLSAARPFCGNYLVPLTLCGRRELIDDRRALGEDILRQYQAFVCGRSELTWSAIMWALSHLRLSMYQLLLEHRWDMPPLASGFSYYGEIELSLCTLVGAKVANMWGGGQVATPPGWNLTFSRFEGKLNLLLTYPRPAIPDYLARRYAEHIETEMFAPG
jgi:hypothetical protein